jgi:hypothetical protein
MTKSFSKALLLSLFLTLVAAGPALGQSVVCSKSLSAKSCELLAEPVEAALKELDAPADWTWVILNGKDWRRATRMFKTEKNTTAAFTVFEVRTTFFSADYLQRRRPLVPTEVIAHELAHILCNCRNEMKARKVGSNLMARLNLDSKGGPN